MNKVCGRYGEYICDATNDDVCSIACRDICISRRKATERATQSDQQDRRRQLDESDDALRRKLGIRATAVSTAGSGHEHESQLQMGLSRLLVDFAHEQEDDGRLPTALVTNLLANHFESPTPVQMQTIPCVLQGSHVCVFLCFALCPSEAKVR